jgi:hypothetical protein
MRSRRPDRWRQISEGWNWISAAGFTCAGAIACVIAWGTHSAFAQGILVNIGSSLLLFALLVFVEPTLIRRLRRPTTLAEAQSRLKALVRPENSAETSLEHALSRSIHRISQQLQAAGLSLEYARAQAEQKHFIDRAGGRVTWVVDWSGHRLRHTVAINDTPRVTKVWESRKLDGHDVSESTAMEIEAFEGVVFDLICIVVESMEPKTAWR